MPPLIVALDQGTTSSRAIAFNASGLAVATAQREFTQHYPKPGWVEHDANEIWQSQQAVLESVVATVGAASIAALGITNQRETTVLWDRASGEPVAPAIVWQDRRTAAHCDQLRAEGKAKDIQARTGLVLDAYFSGTKLTWILNHVQGARARAERGELCFGTVDSWLIFKLSGGVAHVTDVSNASRTLLFNIQTGDWDDTLLALFDIPRAVLPRVVASSVVVGEAMLAGRRIPIGGIAGDQQAALFGQACHASGMAKNTYGTGCFMLMHTGERAVASNNQLLTTVAWRLGSAPMQYALEGSVFIAGAAVQWLRDGLGIIEKASDVEALAASVPDSAGVVLVPAFAGLGAPYWDAYARGTLVGLTRGATRAHIARATLEAIAYQSAEVLTAMQNDSGIALSELRVDGGACANNLLMQFQADVLGVPVVRPRVQETTALGAAYLAGLATGVWRDAGDVARNWQVDRRFEPTMSRDEAGARMATWRRAVERARGWATD